MPAAGAALGDVVDAVARAAEPWHTLYGDSRVVSTAVLFVHLASLVVAAGFALAADRATWRAAAAHPSAPDAALAGLADAHRVVGPALAVTLASGVALALADVETFALAPLFWAKLVLVASLLGNGLAMRRAERALRDEAPGGWARLRRHAAASAALWLATLLAGTTLASA